MKTKTRLCAAFLLAACVSNTNAASLTLNYTGDNDVDASGAVIAQEGDLLTFELHMDFSDEPILGGGFDINFDAAGLQFVSYAAADLGTPTFRRTPDVFEGLLESGAFGEFDGLTGPALVSTMTFRVISSDGIFFIGPDSTEGVAGPFVSAVDFQTLIVPDFSGVTVRAVPVPAAAWLFASGLLALGRFRRR